MTEDFPWENTHRMIYVSWQMFVDVDREDIIQPEEVDYVKALGLKWAPSIDVEIESTHYSIAYRYILWSAGITQPTFRHLQSFDAATLKALIKLEWESFCAKLSQAEDIRVPRLVLIEYGSKIHTSIQSIYVVSKSKSSLLWTDSMIISAWIKGEPSRWTTFVSNRVTKIQSLTQHYQWNHIPSEINPADILLRGASVDQIIDNILWFHCPEFLTLDYQHRPKSSLNDIELPAQRLQRIVLLSKPSTDIIAEHQFVTSYNKLLRIF